MLKLEIQKAHRIVIMSPSPIHLWPSCCKRFIFGQEDALEKDVDPACMQEQIAAKDRELQQFQASAKKISCVGKLGKVMYADTHFCL